MKANRQSPLKATTPWRGRVVLIGIFLLFFVPVLAALLLNIYAPKWQPFGQINHGELVVPAIAVKVSSLKALDGEVLKEGFLTDHWTLVYEGAGDCGSGCETALHNIQQVRLALGKERHRVQRLFIDSNSSAGAKQRIKHLLIQYPGMRVVTLMTGSQFGSSILKDPKPIMLVDPQSFLMMRFPVTLHPSDMLRDLRRLLKLSKRD